MSLTDDQINGFLRSMTQVIKLEAKAMEISGDEVIAQFADICDAALERNRLAVELEEYKLKEKNG
jgi:hypothetical protein